MADYQELLRPAVLGLKPYSPGKPIEEVKRELGLTDVVKLASNENPLGPSPLAIKALQDTAPDVWLYPENEAPELRRALAEHWGVAPEQIVMGAGSDEILHMICLAFLGPETEAIAPDPPFMQYVFGPKLMDATLHLVPNKDLHYDLDGMLERVNERTRVIFLANPDNPTGTMITRKRLDAFLEALPDHVLVVLDEAYYEYVVSEEYPDSLEYIRQGRKVVVTHTFSKAYALAGLRVGYAIADQELIRYLWQVKEPFSVSKPAQAAALASLKDPAQVERTRKLNREGLELFMQACDELGLPYADSQANLLFIDTRRDAKQVFTEMLKRGVIVRSGDVFGMPTFIRVSTGLPEQNRRFVETLKEVLALVPEIEREAEAQ